MRYTKLLILCIVIFVKGNDSLAQTSKDQQSEVNRDSQSKWIKFSGKKIQKGNKITLTAPSGDFFTVNKEAVKVDKDSIYIRNNSHVLISANSIKNSNSLIDCKCPVKILATNREERIPKHGCDTKCYGVVMVCTSCVYNSAGVFIKEETKVCGGCIGIPF